MSKVRVVANVAGEQLPFKVDEELEPYFRDAKDILNLRLAALKSDYSGVADQQKLVMVLAIEALVDALIINEKYQNLKSVVNDKVDAVLLKIRD